MKPNIEKEEIIVNILRTVIYPYDTQYHLVCIQFLSLAFIC